jgi:hypothetical protein
VVYPALKHCAQPRSTRRAPWPASQTLYSPDEADAWTLQGLRVFDVRPGELLEIIVNNLSSMMTVMSYRE